MGFEQQLAASKLYKAVMVPTEYHEIPIRLWQGRLVRGIVSEPNTDTHDSP